ncbi:hypothetical protein BMS3Abin06_01635 [bacterium BMS3Abin06]|nr:hypothetical protein BMS3Abin06_01635 [bacterium BMS3Abin06]HDZ00826.1 hypothetical protein [Nitrospirota bacterium]
MGTALPKLNDVIEKARFLSFEEQEILLDVLKRRHIEKRREQIAANARRTIKEYRAGRAKSGTVQNLKKDLEND